MFYCEAVAKRGDGLKRFFHGASVKKPNIDQCPRCRGTDKAKLQQEGFGISLFHCERCEKEWWS